MDFAARLKQLRRSRGWTQDELARKLGVSRNTVAGYESPRKAREPSLDILVRMAGVFEVSLDQLLGHPFVTSPKPLHRIPLLGRLRPGLPPLHPDNAVDYLVVPSGIDADFAVEIRDKSLLWAGIRPGDVGLCTHCSMAESGALSAVLRGRDSQVVVRYLVRDRGRTVLQPANPEFPSRPVQSGDRVIGVVVCLLKLPPPLQFHREMLTYNQSRLAKWNEVMEEAERYGLKEQQVKSLISLFSELVKRVPTE